MNRTLLGLTFLILASLPAAAQHLVVPGIPELRPERLKIGVDSVAVLTTPKDSAERMTGLSVRALSKFESNGRPIFRLIDEEFHGSRRLVLDTLDVDGVSLQPLRTTSLSDDARYSLTYDGLRLRGSKSTRDSVTRVDTVASRAFFDGGSVEALMAALPVRADSGLQLASLNPPGSAVRLFDVRPVREDNLMTPMGPVPCLVTVRRGSTTEYWISKADGRLAQMRWSLADGTTVRKISYWAMDAATRASLNTTQ